jgi:hypothetical protein
MDIRHPDFIQFLKCAMQNDLRYLCIGGYAVNFYGLHRYTDDMDVWIAPTQQNKQCFLDTLRCMNYSDDEIRKIESSDFTSYFMCSLGVRPHVIDVLTIVHKYLDFDAAEKGMILHPIGKDVVIRMVPYDTLVDIKLRSSRSRDAHDIEMLERLRKGNENNPR